MNLCRSCGEDFSSVRYFDAHRVGVHEYTYTEGLHMDPLREDGRRCLSVHEMQGRGFRKNSSGRWYDPSNSPAARLRPRLHGAEASLA